MVRKQSWELALIIFTGCRWGPNLSYILYSVVRSLQHFSARNPENGIVITSSDALY